MLNNRLLSYLEINGIYAEEQNGFRQKCSCSEHIFSLCTIFRNRKSLKKSTYLAFDHVNRDLLLYKLLCIGIKGNIYESINYIYQNLYCSFNVNNMLTEWCDTNAGLKQGDSFSLQCLVYLLMTLLKMYNLSIRA